MAKNKNARSKFRLAVLLLVVGVCAVSASLIGVYAATSQKWEASFNIAYDVTGNVAVESSAKYQIAGGVEIPIGDVVFQADTPESQKDKTISGSQIVLSRTQQYVDFTYYFKNLSNEDTVQVVATWEGFSDDVENILCTYVLTTDTEGDENTIGESFPQLTLEIPPKERYSIRMRFAIDEITQNAKVSSGITNGDGLSFDLSCVQA